MVWKTGSTLYDIANKKNNNIPVCFELNVRFSGTTPMRAKWGYNDIEAMIREYIYDEDINEILKPVKNGKVYRYFNEYYIDTDMEENLHKFSHVKNTAIYKNEKG